MTGGVHQKPTTVTGNYRLVSDTTKSKLNSKGHHKSYEEDKGATETS